MSHSASRSSATSTARSASRVSRGSVRADTASPPTRANGRERPSKIRDDPAERGLGAAQEQAGRPGDGATPGVAVLGARPRPQPGSWGGRGDVASAPGGAEASIARRRGGAPRRDCHALLRGLGVRPRAARRRGGQGRGAEPGRDPRAAGDASGAARHTMRPARVRRPEEAEATRPSFAGGGQRTVGPASARSLRSGGSTSRGSRPSASMPRVVRQKSRGGNCTGATAPSRK
jgi:hypothetical protein